MFDVVVALQKVLNESAKRNIEDWFSPLPRGAAWHVISDYVFGNPNRHDTASFVILLHHDKLETILEYIDNQAPVDIKKSRFASKGLINYLRSPVAFSFTFVLDDGDNFLSSYAPISEIISGLEEINALAGVMAEKSRQDGAYFSDVEKRIKDFVNDLRGRGNAKLARQVFLVAAYAAVVMDYLDLAVEPSNVSWVSDRDAMLKKSDGIIWDIASIMFYLIKGGRFSTEDCVNDLIEEPKIFHIIPEERGANYLDPLIRMPDYLAASASDVNLHTFEFSHQKLRDIGVACFTESSNCVLCALSWTGSGFLVRRLATKK